MRCIYGLAFVLSLIPATAFAQPKQGPATPGTDTMVKLLPLKKIGTDFLDKAQDSTLSFNRSERVALADSAVSYLQQFVKGLPDGYAACLFRMRDMHRNVCRQLWRYWRL
jgi:hypothetical protein